MVFPLRMSWEKIALGGPANKYWIGSEWIFRWHVMANTWGYDRRLARGWAEGPWDAARSGATIPAAMLKHFAQQAWNMSSEAQTKWFNACMIATRVAMAAMFQRVALT
jgi:hypothetical protein